MESVKISQKKFQLIEVGIQLQSKLKGSVSVL